jgi:hypothetical protein
MLGGGGNLVAEEMECAKNMKENCVDRTEFQVGNVIFLKKEKRKSKEK